MELHAVKGRVIGIQCGSESAQVVDVWNVICRDHDEFLTELVKIAAEPKHILLKFIGFDNEDFVLSPRFARVRAWWHAIQMWAGCLKNFA
jgi:hypothetical protein